MASLICGLYNLHDLEDVSLNIKNRVVNLSASRIRFLKNRYSNNLEHEAGIKDKVNRLLTYLGILQRIREQTLSGSTVCLNRTELQSLMEKIIRLVGKNCVNELCDVQIDKSKEDQWVVTNPYCRSFEEWDKWAKFICGELKLEISAEKQAVSNFILQVTREIITPNVLLAISAQKQAVDDLNLEVSRSDEEIKLDFTLLQENVAECELCEVDYEFLISAHKMSYDIIKTIYDAGLSLEIKNKEVYLKTPLGDYALKDMSGEIDPTYLRKFGMKSTINKKDLLQDYK